MADDPNPDPKPNDDPKPDPDAGAKKALESERKARRDAERQLKDLQDQVKGLEDKDKTELDRLRDENAQLKKDNGDLTSEKLRLEVAGEKGVKARWLSGATREELESAADEYLADHPASGGVKPPPSSKPSPDLKGGTDPTEEPTETDPAKLAASVPRL